MASLLPQIRVTDPERRDSAPTLPPAGAASPSTPPGKGSGTTLMDEGRLRNASPGSSSNTRDSRSRTSGGASPASARLQEATDASSAQAANQLAVEANDIAVDGDSDTAIDPLSQQIFKRTHIENEVRQKLRNPTDEHANRPSTPADNTSDAKAAVNIERSNTGAPGKEKKKGVSFLSRIIGNKKKASADGNNMEDESEAGEARPEGMEAQLFSEPIDNIGFSPRHPQPPGYIKIRSKFKRQREYDRVFLAQELRGNPPPVADDGRPRTSSGTSANASNPRATGNDPIWATEFSMDGKYLAAGGQDRVVRVWAVISTAQERRAHETEEEEEKGAAGGQAQHLNAPVFQKKAYREYVGHESTILDLSWSKNNFLLSSSMDKTVRLWHISRAECLCTFKHTDFVPSIMFHPKDDRFFLAGSLDTKLRLWSIPDKTVAYVNHLPEMITAVSFTPDGKTAIAGTLSGLCLFYETEGLKYQTQIHVRSSHGKNAKGSKITGIQAMDFGGTNSPSDLKLLISSNDSRIRLYNARDKSLEVKFKGQQNTFSQIRATFSDDGASVICGSEDRKAYIWSTGPGADGDTAKARNQHPVEMFEAHTSITTCAILAPQKTRQLLSQSEDPLYDLCNPPPVTLMSRTESITSSNKGTSNGDKRDSTATTTTSTLNLNEPSATIKQAQQSPAYIARSAHPGGQIIVTADYTGALKVFRQDCAHRNRIANPTNNHQNWDAAPIFGTNTKRDRDRAGSTRSNFTGHGITAGGPGGVGRSPSTKSRATTRSRRDSTATTATSATQPASDRILSWRQNIAAGSVYSVGSTASSKNKKGRSVSPSKSLSSARSSRARVDTTPLPVSGRVLAAAGVGNGSGNGSETTLSSVADGRPQTSPGRPVADVGQVVAGPRTPGLDPDGRNPMWMVGDQSYICYKKDTWGQQFQGGGGDNAATCGGGLEPPRSLSYVSTLSSEASGEGAGWTCRYCGGTEVKEGFVGVGKGVSAVCGGCGMPVR